MTLVDLVVAATLLIFIGSGVVLVVMGLLDDALWKPREVPMMFGDDPTYIETWPITPLFDQEKE
jgi:hypothetical protein